MNLLIIILSLLLQRYVIGMYKSPSLNGYTNLFFSKNLISKALNNQLIIAVWILLPFTLLILADYYLRTKVSFIFSVLLYFFITNIALRYKDFHKVTKNFCIAGGIQLPPRILILNDTYKLDKLSKDDSFVLIVIIAIRSLFCALLFSFIFGGYGALFVLLVYTFAYKEPKNSLIIKIVLVLEWLPARLLYITLMLDNNLQKWRDACKSFKSKEPTEELINTSIKRDIFENLSQNKLNCMRKVWQRQLAIWLVSMSLIYTIIILLWS